MQDAIAAENNHLEARYPVRLSLRIGVHSGELVSPEELGAAFDLQRLTSYATVVGL